MVAAPGRVVVTWRSEDGQPLERAPRRAATPRPIVELRATVATQRRRLERLLASGARWPWSRFRDTVLGHPVVSSIVSCLIVELDGCEAFLPALGPPEPAPADVATVRLWHPAGKRVEEVIAWRDLLERERITQPFKQAHREVYLVTDQERADGYSSRRFAGHVVRQHALAELCSARGWSYRLRGPFDPGANTAPTLRIPHARLAAQFDVEPLEDHRLQSGHGIFLYVRTGTLRFSSAPEPSRRRSRITDLASMHGYPRGQAGEPVALESVAPIDLSEVMRDLDLFVSVAGVAADPQWPTTVPDPWPEVWREHAYGELSPLGERRREMLARIVPALPSADRLELQDRFLLVKGNRHRYRIHLGSANVLREPGSRHLCIVPAGSGLRPGDPGHVWLPFEGDDILAQIISKALLLADDDNIADPTIRTQIDAA
jgi:hypothetical protein